MRSDLYMAEKNSIKSRLAIGSAQQKARLHRTTASAIDPVKSFDLQKVVEYLCGFAVFGAFCITCILAITFVNRLNVYFNREKYTPAEFVVTGARDLFEEGVTVLLLTGNVGDSKEDFAPPRSGTSKPLFVEQLLAQYPIGTKIRVLYNPEATRTVVQYETLRVLAATSDVWQREERSRYRLVLWILAVLPGTLFVRWLLIWLCRRRLAVCTSSALNLNPEP